MHMCMHMHMHMCLQTVWESAVAAGEAYYPPTYEADDHYTVTPTQPACLHFRGWVRLLPSWTCGHGCQSSGRVYPSRSEHLRGKINLNHPHPHPDTAMGGNDEDGGDDARRRRRRWQGRGDAGDDCGDPPHACGEGPVGMSGGGGLSTRSVAVLLTPSTLPAGEGTGQEEEAQG